MTAENIAPSQRRCYPAAVMTHALLPYLAVLPAVCYQAGALVAGRKFFAAAPPPADFCPAVTIIKPLKGGDAGLYENLASFCAQDYPDFQLIFVVASADDPAVAVVRRLLAAFPAGDLSLVVDATSHGTNAKVSNLLNAWPRVKHDIVVIADSDVRVEADYLRRLVPFFADPAVGLVTSLYRCSSPRSLAAALEALGYSVEMMPNVIVAARLEGLTFALGASMACRREALTAIGGLESLTGYLADDYQLGNRIARAGWRLALSPHCVETGGDQVTLKAMLCRQLRWGRTMRVSRPVGYGLAVLKEPLLALILLLAVAGLSTAALGPLLLLAGVRTATALIFSRVFVNDRLLPRYLWLLPLRDAVTLVTCLLAFAGNRVTWRGETFRLLPGGTMVRVK